MTGVSAAELLAWNDQTFLKWMELVREKPALLEVPCDVMHTGSVRALLHHIVMVELRYAQRLCGEAESEYGDVPQTPESLRDAHFGMRSRIEDLHRNDAYDWEEVIDFNTRSMGVLRTSRRTVLIHLLMHSIRHYAQLATIARQAGFKPEWPMDYLFMGVVGRVE
jgi:uncharacterized damage-inducible protein DinB